VTKSPATTAATDAGLIAIADRVTATRVPTPAQAGQTPTATSPDWLPAIAVALTVLAVLALAGATTRRWTRPRYPNR